MATATLPPSNLFRLVALGQPELANLLFEEERSSRCAIATCYERGSRER